MAHNLVRGLILPAIIEKIEAAYNVSENAALELFYQSRIGKLYSVDESGLYGQSPTYIFSLFEAEQDALK